MKRNDIITEIYKSDIVNEVISNISKVSKNDFERYYLNDLAQDIYMELLQKDEELLNKMYTDGSLNFYIIRIIKNNICSTTSRYHYLYRRWFSNIDENITNIDTDTEEDED